MQSALWSQILADVLAIPLVTVDAGEGAALGAATLAGTGLGHWTDVDEATKNVVRTGQVVEPSAPKSAVYAAEYKHNNTQWLIDFRDTFTKMSVNGLATTGCTTFPCDLS